MEKDVDNIVNLFLSKKKYSLEDIINECKKNNINDEDLICKILDELKIKGIIYEKKDTYSQFPDNLFIGTLNISDNINYITIDGKTIVIDDSDLNDSLDGDLVTIKENNGKFKIDSIVKRKDGLLTVEVVHKNGDIYLNPKYDIIKHKIIIDSLSLNNFVDGDLLLVKISERLEDNCYIGEFVEYLGHVSDPDDDLELIAKENSFKIDFDEECMKEVDAIPNEVLDSDKINRLDFTNELIFSIDGENTKDRDDAISLSLDEEGNYILGVHIADVSHYVHPGMKLWTEAMDRSTSVYLANSVIPMLPHKLSNGICSLNPDVERLTFSCIVKISPKGQIINYSFVDSFIKSKRALTYDEANDIIEGKENNRDRELSLTLRLMYQLSNILEINKVKRGYIDFGCNDVIVDIDNDNTPIDLHLRLRNKAEKLIANFMQIASECAALYVSSRAPYRVHDKPRIDDMMYALETLNTTGIKVNEIEDVIDPKEIQKLLNQIKNSSDRDIVSNIILRAMKPARYSPYNIGHYGLALEKYSQFTSPIRRASDLMLHVVIKNERNLTKSFSYRDMADFCRHATNIEMNALNANRAAIRFQMRKYIENHYQEKFPAIVTFIDPSGIYIKTSQGIEGKIVAKDIEGDTFMYDFKTNTFKGKKTKYRIKIGSNVLLTPLDTFWNNMINFGISNEDLLLLKKRK